MFAPALRPYFLRPAAIGLALCLAASTFASAAQHTVKEGDTLTSLSRKYGVSVAEIKAANGLDGDGIVLGRPLKIPKPVGSTKPPAGTGTAPVQVRRAQPVNPGEKPVQRPDNRANTPGASASRPRGGGYTVQPGDNLSKLAARYGTTVEAIRAANGLPGEGINVGQSLVIPEKGKTPKPPRAAATPPPAPAGVKPAETKPKSEPPPAPAASAITSTGSTEHYVLEGDRLSLLAKRYGVSVDTIRQANKLEGDLIRVGQLLVIPARGTQPAPTASVTPPAAAPAPARDPDAARQLLARATPGASAAGSGVPVWQRPEHYLDLVNLGDPQATNPRPETQETTTPTPAATENRRSHVVGEGDSLWKIARQYKVSVEQLREANGLTEDSIQVGQKLVVP